MTANAYKNNKNLMFTTAETNVYKLVQWPEKGFTFFYNRSKKWLTEIHE